VAGSNRLRGGLSVLSLSAQNIAAKQHQAGRRGDGGRRRTRRLRRHCGAAPATSTKHSPGARRGGDANAALAASRGWPLHHCASGIRKQKPALLQRLAAAAKLTLNPAQAAASGNQLAALLRGIRTALRRYQAQNNGWFLGAESPARPYREPAALLLALRRYATAHCARLARLS